MKEKDNKELIDRMAEVLRAHSAPYREGAWERFARKQKSAKRVLPIWYFSGAAAAILVGLVFFINRNTVEQQIKSSTDYTQTDKAEKSEGESLVGQEPTVTNRNKTVGALRLKRRVENNKSILAKVPERKAKEETAVSHAVAFDNEKLMNADNSTSELTENRTALLPFNRSTESSERPTHESGEKSTGTANLSAKEREEALIQMLSENSSSVRVSGDRTDETADRRWNIGLMVAPSLTDERFNMGGGVTVAYNISKKVSIGSGVSLVDLGFRQSSPSTSNGASNLPVNASLSEASPMFTARSLETKELTSINTNLLALDIPIDIKYQVSKQFYATAGISFFAVLNEDRIDHFVTRTPINNRTVQNTEGYAFSQPEFQISSVSEKSNETLLQGSSYSGFLNFSFGRRMPVSKKVGIAVEPFFKIPIGSLSNQDMNLRYGGVRVITSF
ncbi:hypothetical protein [Olivibacter sp. XZL3]|uniref:hypothetical protein n=1 Tax=Olivibacter sp. XZL3 TaxID=1735116 RepID=UPI00106695F4|nr:hypothetical protein [Olivibacter sp. XZL3]